jgi:hypothetical protein
MFLKEPERPGVRVAIAQLAFTDSEQCTTRKHISLRPGRRAQSGRQSTREHFDAAATPADH